MQWMAVICAAVPLALANQLPLPTIVQRGWSWHCRCKQRYRRIRPLPLLFYLIVGVQEAVRELSRSVYTATGGARPGVTPITIVITDGWQTPSDPDSVVDLVTTARQQISGLQVYVVAVGPTARWYHNVENIEGMAGSTDRVWYVESPGDIDTAVDKILDLLC